MRYAIVLSLSLLATASAQGHERGPDTDADDRTNGALTGLIVVLAILAFCACFLVVALDSEYWDDYHYPPQRYGGGGGGGTELMYTRVETPHQHQQQQQQQEPLRV